MAPPHLPAAAAPTAAAVTDADQAEAEEATADSPLLRRLLLGHGHGPSIGGTVVTASVLLLPASPDFMRFQGRVLLRGGSQVRAVCAYVCSGRYIEATDPPHHLHPTIQSLALPLALRCGAPGGPVLLDSLRGDGGFQRLWAAAVTPGHQARCVGRSSQCQ